MADEAKKKAKAAERERASAIAEGKWVPAPADKSKAVWFRVAAIVLWVAAIAIELWVIFKILLPDDKEVVTWQILVFLAAMAVLAIAGNLLWRKANRLDPASEQNKFRFFVQNQLGAIITVIAFLPLIILVFLDKDMDGKQKGIIGGIAIAIAAAVFATGVETNPVSQEQITRERNVVQALTGQDQVWYSKKGSKFHVCKQAALVTGRIQPQNLTSGTVAQAHADGVDELTKLWPTEARKHCDVPEDRIQAVLSGATGLNAEELKKTLNPDEDDMVKAPASVPATPNNVTPLPTKAPTTAPTTTRPAA
ncbi:MAG TPA: hypothetical protein PK331_05190 [Gordonia sp. (in: high G+C Gram-positive bacteria)]|uniref:hypothetical protein n=1 Tax=unclassified Gordonia (in: high G+C Gram-positive bacteria) TaxID=2657482 RepID=UPI000FB1FDD0|nr:MULTISPECIES: hypothetical protein [unclassified Gordonia (in: high G+C Gram-positive bacteria)]RUP41547.1 MAG: hypothetical protein EKK60_00560 [Gordonia sp. (in: high G+C Gram-positive bacteria)]HNP56635.1 hypothetical protein [Gordonia sp. (in: high G+C Gram-positive bacteria)]HRC50305.1 hypothetical protein [Gordonia sp. (in: high G+C Gram-positive bacteria)]